MNTFPLLTYICRECKAVSAGWIDRKWETLYLLACRIIFMSVNMSPLSDFFERVKFYD